MTTLTITAKGQITLKQELLRHLNLVPGQKVHVDKMPDGRLMVHPAVRKGQQRWPLQPLPHADRKSAVRSAPIRSAIHRWSASSSRRRTSRRSNSPAVTVVITSC